jgi:hypothetical protein
MQIFFVEIFLPHPVAAFFLNFQILTRPRNFAEISPASHNLSPELGGALLATAGCRDNGVLIAKRGHPALIIQQRRQMRAFSDYLLIVCGLFVGAGKMLGRGKLAC